MISIRHSGVYTAGDHVMTGCKGVLAATLLRALADAKEGGPFAESASRWIFSDQEDGPFTFLKICEALDLAAGRIRRMLRKRSRYRPRLAHDAGVLRDHA